MDFNGTKDSLSKNLDRPLTPSALCHRVYWQLLIISYRPGKVTYTRAP